MISVCGYNGTATADGTDGTLISEGITATGGNNSNPLVASTNLGGESQVIPFCVRANIPAIVFLPLKLTTNNGTDYVASASGEYAGLPAYAAFDGDVSTAGWVALKGEGWLNLHKNTGTLTIYGYKMSKQKDVPSNRAPRDWTVVDATGKIFDTHTGQKWTDKIAESFIFYLDTPVTTNDFTFKFVSNSPDYLTVSEIQFITSPIDIMPTTSKITVSAEGANADKWAFAKHLGGNNAIKDATLTTSQPGQFCTTRMAVAKPSKSDGVINNVDLIIALTDGKKNEEAMRFGEGAWLQFTFQRATPLENIIIPEFYGSNYIISADEVELTPKSQGGGKDWVIDMSTIAACTVLKIISPKTNTNMLAIVYEIIAIEKERADTFTEYGAPLVISAALTDKNMQLYAKCKSVTTDKLGSDTGTKIKIVVE